MGDPGRCRTANAAARPSAARPRGPRPPPGRLGCKAGPVAQRSEQRTDNRGSDPRVHPEAGVCPTSGRVRWFHLITSTCGLRRQARTRGVHAEPRQGSLSPAVSVGGGASSGAVARRSRTSDLSGASASDSAGPSVSSVLKRMMSSARTNDPSTVSSHRVCSCHGGFVAPSMAELASSYVSPSRVVTTTCSAIAPASYRSHFFTARLARPASTQRLPMRRSCAGSGREPPTAQRLVGRVRERTGRSRRRRGRAGRRLGCRGRCRGSGPAGGVGEMPAHPRSGHRGPLRA